MPIRDLVKFEGLRRVLGYDEDPLREVRGAQQIISRRRGDAFRAGERALAERRFAFDVGKEQYKRTLDGYKMLFTQMTEFYGSTPEGDPKREWITQSMEKLFYGMPKEWQGAFRTTTMLRPISAEERRRKHFLRTHPKPTVPTDENGNPLEWTQENEPRIMEHRIAMAEYNQYLDAVTYGTAEAKLGQRVPNMFQGKDWDEGEGGKPIPGSGHVYFRHPETRQVIGTSPRMMGIDFAKAAEWGWSRNKILQTNFAPTGPPKTGLYGGVRTEVTPGFTVTTGESRQNHEVYGTPDEAIKDIPNSWRDALGYLSTGKDWKELGVKDGETIGIMEMLTELEGIWSREELTQGVLQLQEEVARRYPEIPYTFMYDPTFLKAGKGKSAWQSLKTSRNKYGIDGTDWVITEKMTPVTIKDAEGKEKVVFQDARGRLHDRNKNLISEVTREVEPGEVVPEITFSEAAEMLGTEKSFKDLQRMMSRTLRWLVEGQGPERAREYVEALSREFR